ncbi:hypothetical protein [Actinokineospora sp. HUAS TT18]|uniref:hypothetical protein n=1 Tax=Actinokineospora sp. HUAS TT18 TaxID=3447451 RepID=UPI003F51EF6F
MAATVPTPAPLHGRLPRLAAAASLTAAAAAIVAGIGYVLGSRITTAALTTVPRRRAR